MVNVGVLEMEHRRNLIHDMIWRATDIGKYFRHRAIKTQMTTKRAIIYGV
jgi:hypothetical protein